MYYFASDIHLGGGTPQQARDTERRFVAWLERVAADAEAIVLLGDVFDFWFEYREVVPKGCVRALGKLAELSDRGIRILFFTGNHDMWVRDYFARELGVEVHTAPCELELGGRRLFLAHGDNLQIDGLWTLKFMNAVFRSRVLRFLFSWLVHPDFALMFGRWWSGASRKSHVKQTDRTDAETLGRSHTQNLIDFAVNYPRRREIGHFVFGHMHYPREYRGEGVHVVHLGCWQEGVSYAVMDAGGEITLKNN